MTADLSSLDLFEVHTDRSEVILYARNPRTGRGMASAAIEQPWEAVTGFLLEAGQPAVIVWRDDPIWVGGTVISVVQLR